MRDEAQRAESASAPHPSSFIPHPSAYAAAAAPLGNPTRATRGSAAGLIRPFDPVHTALNHTFAPGSNAGGIA